MLCTPPAFILSQDQTLEKIISYLSCLSYNLFSSYSFLASFTLLSIYNSFDEICTLLFALYLSLVVQFSMTVRCLFRDSFVIIPHLLYFVNTFFKTFFKFFSRFFKARLRSIFFCVKKIGGPSGTRTPDRPVMSRLL